MYVAMHFAAAVQVLLGLLGFRFQVSGFSWIVPEQNCAADP